MKKVVVFGAGDTAVMLFDEIDTRYEIICFLEMDKSKIGSKFNGYDIFSIEQINEIEFDEVVLCVSTDINVLYDKLESLNVDKDKINDYHSIALRRPRVKFLEQFSKIVYDKNIQGNVAEVGVFRGEFAKHINQFFPDRTLYLYDTFEGFDKRDLENDKDVIAQGDLSYVANTSVELVLSKMKNPEKCIVRKGYFPDTAREDNEKFCFVSLDTDLYDPIKAGLEYFYPRMVGGGG